MIAEFVEKSDGLLFLIDLLRTLGVRWLTNSVGVVDGASALES